MKKSGIKSIDLSPQLNPIIKAWQASRFDKKYIIQANDIWQLDTNEHGVATTGETIKFGTDYNCKAAIKVAGGASGLWQFAISFHLPNQGQSSPLSTFARTAYHSKADAVEMGKRKLEEQLSKVMNTQHSPKTDKLLAERLIRTIRASRQMQLF